MTSNVATGAVRAFVAIELEATVRAAMARLQSRLKRSGAHVGWIPPANFHLSLAFLGDVPCARIPALQAELARHVADVSPFPVAFAGVGHFGAPAAPRVIWSGVGATPALMAAQQRVAAAARACDIPLESRAYRPHVTLGRVRSGLGREALLAAMRKDADLPLGEQTARHVALMQSRLESTGACYQVMAVAPFSGLS